MDESPWEHIKLTFWPAMLFFIFEYFYLYRKEKTHNFFIAKIIGILIMPVVTLGLFYLYTAITLTEILAVDILTFYIGVIVGQLVCLKIYKIKPVSETLNRYSSVGLVIFAAIVILFTFLPPHIPLFYDSEAGGYGIILIL